MSISLDLGASQFRSLRRRGSRLHGRALRSVYSLLKDSEHCRSLLAKVDVPYAICEDELVLIAEGAVEFSQAFGVQCMPLLPAGKLPADNPPARQIIGLLVESLLPKPERGEEICCLTLPGCGGDPARPTANRELEFFARLLRLRGYRPLVVSAGMSLVLAELVRESFTGIGISFGAATCDLSLAHRGVEIARCAVPVGGNWIDEQAAAASNEFGWDALGNRYLDTAAAMRAKESAKFTLGNPTDKRSQLLAKAYEELLTKVVNTASRELQRALASRSIPQPLTVVAGGGTSRAQGFVTLLGRVLRSSSFPLEINEVRLARASEFTVARGCLIRAELEADTICEHKAA